MSSTTPPDDEANDAQAPAFRLRRKTPTKPPEPTPKPAAPQVSVDIRIVADALAQTTLSERMQALSRSTLAAGQSMSGVTASALAARVARRDLESLAREMSRPSERYHSGGYTGDSVTARSPIAMGLDFAELSSESRAGLLYQVVEGEDGIRRMAPAAPGPVAVTLEGIYTSILLARYEGIRNVRVSHSPPNGPQVDLDRHRSGSDAVMRELAMMIHGRLRAIPIVNASRFHARRTMMILTAMRIPLYLTVFQYQDNHGQESARRFGYAFVARPLDRSSELHRAGAQTDLSEQSIAGRVQNVIGDELTYGTDATFWMGSEP